MPQVSLYIDQETLIKIEQLAHKQGTSISKWVGNNIKKLIRNDYPDGFFQLFGAINDESINKPENLSFNHDAKREEI
ncbi:MAG: toxin-antitoxin system, antitoxin component [Candidatus Riflebacteria bacterium]|nr:toxin-antitoxin system, antitoxin component [Candidatus Riflebacteria bacterium]